MKKYLKLIRVKHYLKNGLLFIPVLFNNSITNLEVTIKVIIGFIVFCLISSFVYIINDINDIEIDRLDPVKSKRAIASGEISIKKALIIAIFFLIIAIIVNLFVAKTDIISWVIPFTYIISNLLYSKGLKNIPLLDIVILSLGFMLRVFYGAAVSDVVVSNWLYLTIMSASFFMGLGKRRGELLRKEELLKYEENSSRKVLKFYNRKFLDKNMYMCLTLTIVFYSLWCIDPIVIAKISNNIMIWTVPLVLIILMRYSLIVESGSPSDPVDLFLKDKVLIILSSIYVVMMSVIYVF